MGHYMKITIIAAALAFASLPAAGDVFLDINGTSKHSKDTYIYDGVTHAYNSRNIGLGLTYGLNKYLDLSGGFYDNSYYKLSVYGGLTLKHDLLYGNFRITPGVSLGVATGYSDTPVQAPALRPTVAGMITLDNGKIVPFCIGCSKNSPIDGGDPKPLDPVVQPKGRLYWYLQK